MTSHTCDGQTVRRGQSSLSVRVKRESRESAKRKAKRGNKNGHARRGRLEDGVGAGEEEVSSWKRLRGDGVQPMRWSRRS